MLTILTAISSERPLLSYIKGIDKNGLNINQIVRMYHGGTGATLKVAEENVNYIKSLFETNEVICNDFKSHIKAFKLRTDISYNIYDCGIGAIDGCAQLSNTIKSLASIVVPSKSLWMKLLSDASLVYHDLEIKGYNYFGQIVYSKFNLDTYSGRTRSTGFSIHNKNKDDDIKSTDPERNVFIHFDWIAADIRFGAILSNDTELNAVYNESDPYSYIVESLGNVNRDEIKISFLKALYNVEYDDPIFGLYPDFAEWLKYQHALVSDNKPVYNVVERPFFKDSEHDNKSVVNAILQGSVAAAVQAAFVKIHKLDSNILMTDIYDSIVCACSSRVAQEVIDEVGKIIYRPFDGILDNDIRLPYRVSVGSQWCQWRPLKTIR